MGKAKLLGAKSNFVPNSKADVRFHRKIYQRNRKNYTSNSTPVWKHGDWDSRKR